MVKLELYKVFYTVAKLGSLTKASDELFISQPAVSQAIKQLESQLGTTLFIRTHKGMELSPNGGQLIFGIVEESLSRLEDVEDYILKLSNTATGTIRIGASDTIFEYCLADKIVKFHELYPEVKFELFSDVTPVTLERLKEGKCDVAFINMPIAEDPELTLKGNVMLLNDIFIANDKFSELKGKKIPIAELSRYPLIFLENNTVARRAVNGYLHTIGVNLTPDIEVRSWHLMKRLASEGMGIGCIPREYVMRALYERKDIFEVETDPALPVRSVGVALPKDGIASFAVRKFITLFNLNNV